MPLTLAVDHSTSNGVALARLAQLEHLGSAADVHAFGGLPPHARIGRERAVVHDVDASRELEKTLAR